MRFAHHECMGKILNHISHKFEIFRVCVHCGGILVRNSDALISDRMLCYVCEHKLELHRNLYVRNDYEHEVYSAYSWTEVNEILVRNIVRGLKGGGAERLRMTR